MHTPQRQLRSATEQGPLIFSRDLLQALEEKKGDFKGDRWAIIREIIEVREQLESLHDGSEYFDPSTVIHVTDFSEPRSKNEADANNGETVRGDESNIASGESTAAPTPKEDELPGNADVMQLVEPETTTPTHLVSSAESSGISVIDGEIQAMHDQEQRVQLQGELMSMPVERDVRQESGPGHLYGRVTGSLEKQDLVDRSYMKMSGYYPPLVLPQHGPGLQDWMGGLASPADMAPLEYTFNGMPCQSTVPGPNVRLDDSAMALHERAIMGGNMCAVDDHNQYQTVFRHANMPGVRESGLPISHMPATGMQEPDPTHGIFFH
jgi:hypothetical protein